FRTASQEEQKTRQLRPLVAGRRDDPSREAMRFTDLGPGPDGTVQLAVTFEEGDPITLTFSEPAADQPRTARRDPRWSFPLTARREPPPTREFTLSRIETGGRVVALSPGEGGTNLSETHGRRLSARPLPDGQ
ncbi:MAG: hypothetical protein AAF907_01230, partial [Planctomycetota bacterium]